MSKTPRILPALQKRLHAALESQMEAHRVLLRLMLAVLSLCWNSEPHVGKVLIDEREHRFRKCVLRLLLL